MYFDEYGNSEKATIVFLHGAALTDTFSNQYIFQQDYHLVVPHLYGSGREVKERYEPQKTIAALVDLIRSLNKHPVMLVGHTKKITHEQYAAWFKERIFLDEQPNYAKVKIPMLAVCGEKEFSEIKTSVVELGNRNQNCQTLFLKGGRHDQTRSVKPTNVLNCLGVRHQRLGFLAMRGLESIRKTVLEQIKKEE